MHAMRSILLPMILVFGVVTPLKAETYRLPIYASPSIADIAARLAGNADADGRNPVEIDQVSLARASVGGQMLTRLVAGFGSVPATESVGAVFGIALEEDQPRLADARN